MDRLVHQIYRLSSHSELNIMIRQQLQEEYINQVLEDMDIKDALALLFDFMSVDLDNYSDEDLIAEVGQFYPELLEDVTPD